MAADVGEPAASGQVHRVAPRSLLELPIRELAAAIRFLTRVPLPAGAFATSLERAPAEPRTGGAAFGIVGLGLGAIGAVPIVFGAAAHPVPAALIALGTLAVLSGALHLDGLADTADALAAPAGTADRARTDPRTGSAAVVALLIVIGLDAALVAELSTRGTLAAATAFLVAAVGSRASAPIWAVLVGRRSAGPAGGGLGRWFAERTSPAAAIVAALSGLAVAAGLAAIAGPWLIGAAVAGSLLAAALGGAIVAARGGLDGDGYGALIEIAFTSVLLAAVVVR